MEGYNPADTRGSAELDPEIGEGSIRSTLESFSEKTPLLPKKDVTKRIGKLWLKKRHSQFWDDFEVSLRGAFFASVVGIPFLFPRGYIWWIDVLVDRGIYHPGVIVMFIYTLYKSVGETVMQAWQGIAGTLWAAVAIWLMYGFFHDGVRSDTPEMALYFGFVCLAAFVILTLWLNVSILFQIFAINNFVYFAMTFVDGKDHTSKAFNQNFELEVRAGSAVSGLLVAVIGCGIAVLATLVPYPVLSIRKAKDFADRLTAETTMTWENCVKFYCSPVNAVYQRDHLARDLNHLQEEGASMAAHISSSWWECFGLGRWQRLRVMLTRHQQLLCENHDRLCCVMNLVLHETWEESHGQLMAPLVSSIDTLVDEARLLYEMITVAVTSGGIASMRDADAMKLAIVKVKAATRALTSAFQKSKGDSNMADLNMEQIDEHSFCFNICAYGRLACETAEELIADSQGTRVLSPSTVLLDRTGAFRPTRALTELFDRRVLFDPVHLNFLLRNSLMIGTCFVIGHWGYNKSILPNNADIAGTAAILLSKFGGSAVSKNLDRLQGLILGTVIGQCVHMLLGWCTWYYKLFVIAVVMLWNTGSIFMYLNSRKYATVGCLLAAFGTDNFLRLCTDASTALPNQTYYAIIDCVVAIFVIILIDTIFAYRGGGLSSRASDRAHASYVNVWRDIIAVVADLLNPEVTTTQADTKARLAPRIDFLNHLNTQAIEEPRYWRTPWKKKIFADGIACATSLRLTVCCMEYAVADTVGGPKTDNYMRILAMASFAKIKDGVMGQAEQLESFLRIFLHETEDSMTSEKEVSELRDWSSEVTTAIGEFMEEAMATKSFVLHPECGTLEDDPFCEVSLLLSCIDNLMCEMRDLQSSIIRGE